MRRKRYEQHIHYIISAAFLMVIGFLGMNSSTSIPLDEARQKLIEETASSTSSVDERKVSLTLTPSKIEQGNPLIILVKGAEAGDTVQVTYANSKVAMTHYQGNLIGFVPIDLNQKPGIFEVRAVVKDAEGDIVKTMTAPAQVINRNSYSAPLGIPDKLGGNTPQSAKNLVNSFAEENKSLTNLGKAQYALWTKQFIYPLAAPEVSDPYGYTRLTGAYTIAHKGTDFKAAIGTELYAVNDGIVRLVNEGRNYGKTVAIDHGNGLVSYYIHLSEFGVALGDKVTRGDIIGLSGDTGYAEVPHLHFSLRINDISVDPVEFLEFFE